MPRTKLAVVLALVVAALAACGPAPKPESSDRSGRDDFRDRRPSSTFDRRLR